MSHPETTPAPTCEPLGHEQAARLVQFARACRAAARAVGLYPPDHPSIRVSLTRLAEAIPDSLWPLDVFASDIRVDGRPLPRSDIAVSEFGQILHAHHIGHLVVHPDTDAALWLQFLRLLSTPPEDLRREGGIARVWATSGGHGIDIHELDFHDILRTRLGADDATWDTILRGCLLGTPLDLDEEAVRALAEIVTDPRQLAEISRRLEEQARAEGLERPAATALLALLATVVEHVSRTEPARLDPLLAHLADGATRMSPDLMLGLMSAAGPAPADAPPRPMNGEAALASGIVSRLNDTRLAEFLANAVISGSGAPARLAEAFLALVPQLDRRARLLSLAHDMVSSSPPGQVAGAEALWNRVQEMVCSYTDQPWVGDEYERDLATARTRAADVEAISDDPPERISAWLATVGDAALRSLDLQMLRDLLALEDDEERWTQVANLVVAHVDDLVLVGDFAAAHSLIAGLAALGESPASRNHARAAAALDRLIAGRTLASVVEHLDAVGDEDFVHVKALCLSLGAGAIKPLAEMLAAQERARVRQRLTDLLLAFGSLGRQSAEQLKNSPNPSVRRVAVYLLREFGGTEALPDLASLLDDAEPNVQREAVRAILLIGTEEAYSVLERALASGSERSRAAILHQLDRAPEERAAPLFVHIVRGGDHRRSMKPVYLKALTGLGRVGGDAAVDALAQALRSGRWWQPVRSSALRLAAARSLRQIGTARAADVLDTASRTDSFGVRKAVARSLP